MVEPYALRSEDSCRWCKGTMWTREPTALRYCPHCDGCNIDPVSCPVCTKLKLTAVPDGEEL